MKRCNKIWLAYWKSWAGLMGWADGLGVISSEHKIRRQFAWNIKYFFHGKIREICGDHTETVDIEFDPRKTNYKTLLNCFWKWHNPTSSHSRQYMSAIFYHNDQQRELAEKTRDEHQQHTVQPIVTVIQKAGPFYDAEDYHQKYILRQHPHILEKLNLTDAELIKSKVATRLNGYLGGYGSSENFAQECEELELPEAVKRHTLQQIRKKEDARRPLMAHH